MEEAAGRLFVAHGYPATTMQSIADEAGVHVQTIYLAYSTKAAVLAAAAARLVAGDDDPATHPSERAWVRRIQATDDPARRIRLYARHIRDLTPRVLPLIDSLRATAPGDSDVAAFLEHMMEGRREGPDALFAPVAEAGQLRPGLRLSDAADIVYALAGPDTYRSLVEERGWSWARAERWITEQLVHALLGDPD